MIKTWIADVLPLKEPQKWERYYNAAPMERKKKADKILKEEDRLLSIGAWSLYAQAVKKYGLNENAVYNFSHSGHYVLCCIDTECENGVKAGCDIERETSLRLNVAKRFFCESEYRMILNQREPEKQLQMFYRYWVLKESFMKATRLGMKLPMNAFVIEIDCEDKPKLIVKPEDVEGTYVFKEYKYKRIPYKIAVCASGFGIDIDDKLECLLL